MATPEEIAAVRSFTNEPMDPPSDADIGMLVDQYGVEGATSIVWQQKAAKYADMVNVSEAGASHSFSDLMDHALKMASKFAAEAGGGTDGGNGAGPGTGRSVVHLIVRP